MTEIVTKVAKAMAENAGFAWDACAQSQWESDARAGIEAFQKALWTPLFDQENRFGFVPELRRNHAP